MATIGNDSPTGCEFELVLENPAHWVKQLEEHCTHMNRWLETHSPRSAHKGH